MVSIDRTVTDVTVDPERNEQPNREPVELVATRGDYAYVLLGDPGSGKTTLFRREAQAVDALFLTAREFLIAPPDREACAKRTLFIDALDEMRAGVQDGRTVLDQIRRQLLALNVPPFRLSCREADWLGSSDSSALSALLTEGHALKTYRLNLLTDANIEFLLREKFDIADATLFVRSAAQFGVHELLRNPQSLTMLAKAVLNGKNWPNSRERTYEMACTTLAKEFNQEHQSAKRKSWPDSMALLDAAGLICVVFLCADCSSVVIGHSGDGAGKPLVLKDITGLGALSVSDVIETNLFVAVGQNQWAPAHRSIAEFLAARYVAKLIARGLPPARITSLMLGTDGGVVTSLRGLNAWLATCSLPLRSQLTEVDPQGVLLYGDVKAFSKQDKAYLLTCLRRCIATGRWRAAEDWNAGALAAMVTQDMADVFTNILRESGRDDADQALADLVVTALSRAPKLDEIGPVFIDVVRDASRWSGMRRYALRTYLKTYADSDDVAVEILDAVARGHVIDDDDDLLGILLIELYPRRLSVTGALRLLRDQKARMYGGRYWYFWAEVFLKETTDVNLPTLLDALAVRPKLADGTGNETYWRLASESLVRGVEVLGDDTDDEQLYQWLGVTLGEYDYDHINPESLQRLHAWLIARPARLVRLLRVAIERLDRQDRLWVALRRLHDPKWPACHSALLLELAENEESDAIAEDLFEFAVAPLYDPMLNPDLSFEKLEHWVAERPKFALPFERFCQCPMNDWRMEQAARHAEERIEKQDRIEQYRQALNQKSPGEINIQGLYYLALAHAGLRYEARGDTPVERLRDFLGGDETLVSQALAALSATPTRRDLPAADQILESYLNDKEWLLARALIVGFDASLSSKTLEATELPESTLRAALMASYATPVDREAAFRVQLALARPQLVADAFVQYSLAALKAGKSTLTGAHELTEDTRFAVVARLALPHVLRGFPRRATLHQLYDLARFIKGFAFSFSASEALDLVTSKLALKTLDVGQRTYWLAVGLRLAPKKYEKRTREWVTGNEIRIGHLGAFLERRDDVMQRTAVTPMPASAIGMLVEAFAPYARPDRPDGVHSVSADMQRGDQITSWIHDLAARPSEEAEAELTRLQTVASLVPWIKRLRRASAAQRIVQRDANYKFPEVRDVVSTLDGGRPANAADLHAIVIDQLRQIANEIERSDLDSYKQYWNTDENHKPTQPKVEEANRDSIALILRTRLEKKNVACVPEARHADRKRSDLVCSFGTSIAVPIEVKNQMHPDIWRAIREQLAEKYTSDPRACGYGVYLVFWFGPTQKLASPMTGRKPKTAKELAAALEATLTDAQRRSIAICVIDVSKDGRRG